MKEKIIQVRLAAATFCLLILILNVDTAVKGAQEGLELCIQTIIPSLFPFFDGKVSFTISSFLSNYQ